VRAHTINGSDKIKDEIKDKISKQFGKQAPELQQASARRHRDKNGRDGKPPALWVKMKDRAADNIDMKLNIDDKQKVDFQVDYYKHKINQFANIQSLNQTSQDDMVRHLAQIENSIETIERYVQSKHVPRVEIEWTGGLKRSLAKSRDMLKVIIFFCSENQDSCLSNEGG